MQPSDSLANNNIPLSSKSAGKRKLVDPQNKTAGSDTTTQTPHSGGPTNPPASKKLKTSSSAGNLGRRAEMTKNMGIFSRPGVVDLTRTSHFQPHTGPKRLVIKNLRTSSRKDDINQYYERTWNELDIALTSVFAREQPSSPLEVLCRGVEAICRRGRAEQLAKHLKDRSKLYLEKQLLPLIEKEAGPSNVDALRTVHKFWTIWNEQSVRYTSMFYCIRVANLKPLDSHTFYFQLP